jgi:hypothetical protein
MNILGAIRREKRKLEKQVGRLQRELEGLTTAARVLGNSAAVRLDNAQKTVLSAAGRAKISAAAKRRWAKLRAGTDGFGTAKKRVMSAAARAKISAAAKRRWAKLKAGAKKAVS